MNEPTPPDTRVLALAGTVVAEMVVPILMGIAVEREYECRPWGLVVGSVIGIGGSFLHLMLISRRT
jgi:F0F1-type ATP synthase assembly protein I